MIRLLQQMADYNNPNSFSCRRRAARMAPLVPFRDRPLRVLDLGGTPNFWLKQPTPWHQTWKITTLNLTPQANADQFDSVLMDVTQLKGANLKDNYDLIFSNSLIEHLGPWVNKRLMCDGILASGLPYFVQTPNFWFPIEPHILIPGLQFMPRVGQVALMTRNSHGAFRTGATRDKAREWIDAVHLLTVGEMRELLPGCKILRERVFGLTKSFVAYNLQALG